MGSIILKTRPDADLYMYWSSITESPVFVGPRLALMNYLSATEGLGSSEPVRKRIERTDLAGTSARFWRPPYEGSWEDTGIIYDQAGWLPRELFHEFALAILNDEDEYVYLRPLDDDDV